MKKFMLINPPQKSYNKSEELNLYVPIGLLYIVSMIKNKCEVIIFDALINNYKKKINKDHIIFGTDYEEIRRKIKKYNPDIVGVSIPFSAQASEAKKITKICKEINPKIITLMGGPDPSVNYKKLLEEDACDYCIIGEGEETISEFMDKINNNEKIENINGLAYKNKDKIYFKPRIFLDDLDKIPFPSYEYLDMNKYLKNKYLYRSRSYIHKKSISVITSRGCPFNCVFCSVKLHMGRKFRFHSPEYIIKHLKLLVTKYKIKNFHFEDDNISLNKERFEKILDLIIKEKLNIKWDLPNGIRADTLNYEILKKMKKSGCQKVQIAIESGNQEVLNNIIKKATSLKTMIQITKYCKKLNLRCGSFFVIGFPGETIKNMKETTSLALKLFKKENVEPWLMVATPLYGTELYDICIKNNYIKDLSEKALASGTQMDGTPLISTKEFKNKDVKKICEDYSFKYKKLMIIYFIKNPLFGIKRIIFKIIPIILERISIFFLKHKSV